MSDRRRRPVNKVGCKPVEDVCVEHDEPLVCRHGCGLMKKPVHDTKQFCAACGREWLPGAPACCTAAREIGLKTRETCRAMNATERVTAARKALAEAQAEEIEASDAYSCDDLTEDWHRAALVELMRAENELKAALEARLRELA